MAKESLLNLPMYHRFVERYAADFEAFCFEVCGIALSPDQRDLALLTPNPRAKVSVVSGTGTGKTALIACICLWSMWCHPIAKYDGKIEIGSNTYVGAASLQQVADGVWKEMQDRYQAIKATGNLNWLISRTKPNAEKWYIEGYKDQWFITKIAMAKGNSVAIAGKHRYWQTIIVDEASGVQDEHFNVITGTQTQDGNRTFLFSQGTKTTGYFYDTHHSLSHLNNPHGGWVNLCFSSENAPHVSREWIRQRRMETGGVNSVEYQIRVLGKFAEDEEKTLINRRILDAAMNDKTKLIKDGESWGWFLLVDVAAGEYRDYSVCVLARVIGNGNLGDDARRVEYVGLPIYSNSIDVKQFKGRIVEEYAKLSNARVVVDAGGNGLQLCKDLEDEGLDVFRVQWGSPCFKKENKDRFINLRAQAMVHWRDSIRERRSRYPKDIDKKTMETFIYQATHLPYKFTDTGKLRYQMVGKDQMRSMGIKSPDIADAMSFAFLEGLYYNVSDGAYSGSEANKNLSAIEKARLKMAEMERKSNAES